MDTVHHFGSEVRRRVETFHPAYFALVMATGIVSVACHLLGLHGAARWLSWLNVVAYGAVWAVNIARAVLFSKSFLADWRSHQRGPGFFTVVAATSVLGVQAATMFAEPRVATVLFWLALASWAVCTYGMFGLLGVRDEKPSIAEGINGGWLLAVVATQSLCVLGCKVLPESHATREAAVFFLASLWGCGGMLYIWIISLIFYRYMFFKFDPSDLMPPYWINMGAVAISTLAGTALVQVSADSVMLASVMPFVKGFTLVYWATATWWIPMLFVLGLWRHGTRGFRFVYDALYWGLVFPLGMYAVCTYRLAQTFDAPFLLWIARAFVVLAFVAWTLTFFGLAARLLYLTLLLARSLAALEPNRASRAEARNRAVGGSS